MKGLLASGFVILVHSWYPAECCSDKDCQLAGEDLILELKGGFSLLETGEFVARGSARLSHDGSYHICRGPEGSVRCFFYPNRGV